MQKKFLTLLCSALITASAVQVAAAAQPRRSHVIDRTAAIKNQHFRNSNAYVPLAPQPDLSHYSGGISAPAGR